MQDIPFYRKPIAIAGAVALLHVGGLAALQSGLLVRAYELVVPAEMISQIIEPPQPEVAPPPPPAPPPTPVARSKQEILPPAPQPLAIADPAPAPNAPQVTAAPPAPLPPIASPVAAAPSPAPAATAPVATPKIEEPIVEANHNADSSRFKRHRLSEQLGEHGVVVVNVLVGIDGSVKQASIIKSSGFPRLDESALRGARVTRFKPALRSGIPIERAYPLTVIYEEIK